MTRQSQRPVSKFPNLKVEMIDTQKVVVALLGSGYRLALFDSLEYGIIGESGLLDYVTKVCAEECINEQFLGLRLKKCEPESQSMKRIAPNSPFPVVDMWCMVI